MRIKNVPTESLESATGLLRALADPVRLRLLNLLAGAGEVCVCHLHGALDLPQPTVSRHLATLRHAGLVVGRKDGLWVHYRLATAGSTLHRHLLDGLAEGLAEVEMLRDDRRRLARLVGCCESP